MSRLILCLLVWGGVLVAGAAPAQHRPPTGQALVARPPGGRYARLRGPHFRPLHRTHYQYAPSYHAYYNRRAYQPHVYVHRRRPSGRPPVATLRPRMAGQ